MKQKGLKITKGEIHLIPFPFTDLSNNKLRLCVVIGCDRTDITVVFLTSIKPKDTNYIQIAPTKENRLKTHSYIRYTKIATLDAHMSLGKTGILEKKMYQTLIKSITGFIDFSA